MTVVLLHERLVFIVGFLIGFITVLLYKYTGSNFESPTAETDFPGWKLVKNPQQSNVYEKWRQSQNLRISKMNLDAYAYGMQYSDSFAITPVLESEWLKDKVLITCVVFVEKLKLGKTIKETWGKHCNHLLFFSQRLTELNLPVIDLGIKFKSSWQLLCEVMNYLWRKRDEISLDWILFVKDDTFVVPENLRRMVAPLDFRESHYLGHAVVLWGTSYNVAQAGYVLSYGALRRLMEMFDTSEKCAAGGKYWKNEDYYLGKHLASLGIEPMDTRDSGKKGTFHGLSLSVLLGGTAKLDLYYTRVVYPPAPECCSSKTITFNMGDADKMRTIDYIVNHLCIFEDGIYGNKPAPTPIPEDQIWKFALREEFNLTDVEDISAERYFQIWRSKYSEPELFIAKKFRSHKKISHPVSEAYEVRAKGS